MAARWERGLGEPRRRWAVERRLMRRTRRRWPCKVARDISTSSMAEFASYFGGSSMKKNGGPNFAASNAGRNWLVIRSPTFRTDCPHLLRFAQRPLRERTRKEKRGSRGTLFRGCGNDAGAQYLLQTVTPTFWKVFISSNTLLMPLRSQVPVTMAFGETFFASIICSIPG